MYASDPEWEDIEPIPLPYNDKSPVVQIMYSERFKDVYGYMAAVMKREEYSERALALSRDAIDCNTANYTVWHYRREILKNIDGDLKEEMLFTSEVIGEQPKNYQVWHHRRCIIELSGDPSEELLLTSETLSADTKNYHAWDHRQWVLSQYSLWDGELQYIDELLKLDLRNNSAWNHRYFVIENTEGWTKDVIERELKYAGSFIKRAPNNESSWNYARGIIKKNKMKFTDFPTLKEICLELEASHVPSTFMMSTLADIHIEEGSNSAAIEVFEKMKDLDVIRVNYWSYRQNQLQDDCGIPLPDLAA